MSIRPVLVLLACCALPLPVPASEAGDAARAAQENCFDPAQVRNWEGINLDQIVVDTGRKQFHVQLRSSCPELAYNHTATFLPGTGGSRICGRLGDRMLLPQGSVVRQRCGIGTVTPIDRERYRAYLAGKDADAGDSTE